MNYTVKEAQVKTIYFIETYNEKYERRFLVHIKEGEKTTPKFFVSKDEAEKVASEFNSKVFELQPRLVDCDFRVSTDNLYDFVMLSIEETTSPRGVEPKLHIRENGEDLEVWTWGTRGQFPKLIDSFKTLEDAEDFIFNKTFEYDFSNDNNRSTLYFDTQEEAELEIIQRYADNWSVGLEVAKSILKKKKVVDEIKEQREFEEQLRIAEQRKINQERINKLAEVYASMIEPQKETFKETASRLGEVIGEKIEKEVFFTAVKLIRQRFS
ncbi:MAG TPA: hypothetical protein PLH91_00535 [Tenuifilaceae bacterium]|nr:hypothetical protein [Tenuifilaceae bacterium]